LVAIPAAEWLVAAMPYVVAIAEATDEFTTDRVEWVLAKAGVAPPNEPRAMGTLMRKASLAGIIDKTDRVRESVMPSNHRRPKAIWRSAIREDRA
jgi:hypothetical protein